MRLTGILDLLSVLFSHKRVQPRGSLLLPQQEFAVIGLGRFGTSVALTLVSRGHTVLGVDADQLRVQELSDDLTQTVRLDATDEDALRDIDIDSYPTVVVAIGSQFEANLMTTVALKALGVRSVICKASTERQKSILLSVGADRVVLPEHDSGQRVAQELSMPGILDQIAVTQTTKVMELRCPAKYVGKTLRQLAFDSRYSVHVVASARAGKITANPDGDYMVTDEDLLIVIGEEVDIARLISV